MTAPMGAEKVTFVTVMILKRLCACRVDEWHTTRHSDLRGFTSSGSYAHDSLGLVPARAVSFKIPTCGNVLVRGLARPLALAQR